MMTSQIGSSRRRGGFTLLELLMVILVIAVLMALLLSAVMKVKTGVKTQRANAAALALKTAIGGYHVRHHQWPCPDAHLDDGSDHTYEGGAVGNVEIVRILTGESGPFRDEVEDSPYIDLVDYPTDEDGNLLDPWRNPYRVTIDINYDGTPADGVSVTW